MAGHQRTAAGRAARIHQLTLEERDDLAALLARLDADAWSRPTPCPGWTVRDVVAHLVGWDGLLLHTSRAGRARAMARWSVSMARCGFSPDRLNDRLVGEVGSATGAALGRRFATQVSERSAWLFERVAPGAQLAEYVIHHHDIRTAVDDRRVVPPDRLRAALDGVRRIPALRVRPLLARNQWVATDLDWRAGRGPLIELPGEDVLLALAGRTDVPV